MASRKRDGDEVAPPNPNPNPNPCHYYPTRWKLGRHTSHSSLSKARRIEYNGKDGVLVACKGRKEERHTPYLPREVIFNILVLIPAKVLHEVMRYVCKQWYDIVSDPLFIRVHHQMSPAGFLIQESRRLLRTYYIETDTYYIEADTARLNGTDFQIPFPARIWGSLNGLVLLHDLTNPEVFHVMNLVTKVKISLPPLVGLKKNLEGTGFAVTSSGHYKVVHVSCVDYCLLQMSVFTVGSDKAWRFIDIQGILMNSEVKHTTACRPCFIAGFIYWLSSTVFGFALDVDREIIYEYFWPNSINLYHGRPTRFLNMGTCLGTMEVGEVMCRLWKLVDVKSGKWTELASINMRAVRSSVDKISYPSVYYAVIPVRLIDEDFWFYRFVGTGYVVVRYNLANDSFAYFPITTINDYTLLHPHVHTLLSPKNC